VLEALILRLAAWRHAEMPFADVRGAVALFFQHISQRGLLHPDLVLLRRIDVVIHPEAGGKLAAHDAHARWHANGRDGVGAGELRALRREPVEMRCGNFRVAKGLQIGIAHVVGEDDEEVGALRSE
jgi:hypothetical protein